MSTKVIKILILIRVPSGLAENVGLDDTGLDTAGTHCMTGVWAEVFPFNS